MSDKPIPNVKSFAYSRSSPTSTIHAGGNYDYAWPLCRNHVRGKGPGYWSNDSRDITCKNCLKLRKAYSNEL